jgi:hypothetical protein
MRCPFPVRGVRIGGLQSERYGHLFGHLTDEAVFHRCPDAGLNRWPPVIRSSQIHHLAPPDDVVLRPDRFFVWTGLLRQARRSPERWRMHTNTEWCIEIFLVRNPG